MYNRDDTPIVNKVTSQSSRDVSKPSGGGGGEGKRRPREGRRKTIQVTLNRSFSKEGEEGKETVGSPTTPTLEQGNYSVIWLMRLSAGLDIFSRSREIRKQCSF